MLRKFLLAVVVLAAVSATLWVWRPGDLKDALATGPFRSTAGFVEYPLPIQHSDRLFDIGVVDANGDGWLDIYTSNHHFRQALLIADGKGGYRDVMADWRLDQSSEFPLSELSFTAPEPDRPGVYVYWRGTNVVVRAHGTQQVGGWRGSMRVYSGVKIVGRQGFEAEAHESRDDAVVETRVDFKPAGDGMLVLTPGSQGLPLVFDFEGDIRTDQIFVGLGKVQPKSAAFSLAMRDRHAMAWADFNADGVMDVFVNRGALGGTLRAFPAAITDGIRDELLLSSGPGKFTDAAAVKGIEKEGCSGRHAMWVDFDGDGLLDLFVNCYDRENVTGDYPKQLYRQHPAGVLRNVASDVGLGLPDQQMGNLVWLDVDGDGDQDLLAFQDEGLFLYRHDGPSFVREVVAARSVDPNHKIGQSRGTAAFYDGKLPVGDFDGDGRPDVFSSSRRGNVLLRNENGHLVAVDLATNGLPAASMYAAWVDYDNDGRLDLHLFPQGLYHQRADGRFEQTGILATHPDAYLAAIAQWADLDGDGRLDVLLALDENPDFKPWWRVKAREKQRARWTVVALRNELATTGQWLQVDLLGADGNRQGIGATVAAKTGPRTQVKAVGHGEGSFFSQGLYRLHFGLGDADRVDSLLVRWSDGTTQEVAAPPIGQRIKIEHR
ncbi:MAG: CRTAC1 family protein [Rubrivivax sp.]|nr:CRTAC1 family protein [Rubrivivax sp.]